MGGSVKNIMTGQKRYKRLLTAILFGLGAASSDVYSADVDASQSGGGDVAESNFHVGGYVAGWAAFNLNNIPETPQNDRYDLNMLRGSISLNADFKTGPLQWKAIVRGDKEFKTDFLKRLEKQNQAGPYAGGPGSDIMSLYDRARIRELYVDYDPTDRIHLRLGKQQEAWGESDFFHLTDLIEGIDYRWHFFLERETDEIRKPLIMANAKVDFPEANGTLQFLLRPGWDRKGDLGNTFDLSGSRWAEQPNRGGNDWLKPIPFEYRHPGADSSDPTGGVRWTGVAGPVNYSLSYLKAANPNMVVNSMFKPWKGVGPTNGNFANFINPTIDLFGASISGTIPAIDSVVGAEVAYQRDVPYNVGSNFYGFGGFVYLPGFNGITTKNVVVSSLRLDKQLKLMDILGTNQASFASIQIFDTWIRDFKSSDDLVEQAGFGAPVREHTTMVSGFVTLNYMSSRLNPGLAFAYDLTNGDGLLSPLIDYNYGTHWRFRAEADLFYANNAKQPGQVENKMHTLGGFDNHDQLMFRVMYQF